MDELRKQLSDKSLPNVDGHRPEHQLWFVPRPALDQIVNETAISKIIDAINLPVDEDDALEPSFREGLKLVIHDKAKITFAISCYVRPHCLRHIRKLIHHGYEKGSKKIDHRLPLSKNALSKYGFNKGDADSFFEAQWHFIAPKIQLGTVVPIEFRQQYILPFQAVEADGMPLPETGAFSKVVKVRVTPGHQVKPVYNGPLLRKQFKPETGSKASPERGFKKELRNLAILSSARHENIIQLLAAYFQGESFNFIFPLASYGNLEQFFEDNTHSSWTDREVVFALSGLASALVIMHQFTTGNLHLIGCHRDLKPANILVDEKRLLLADFGLSRFVDSQESLTSTAPDVGDDFAAPEHYDKEDFSPNRIGWSSDIWAFGCVTLMFLLYLLRGKEGVDQLQSQRRVEARPRFTHHYFHNFDKDNPGLEKLFKQLDSDHSASTQGLLYLVKKMITLQKDERPKATTIDAHMRSLVIHLWSTKIEEQFDKACKGGYVHVKYEWARLKGWHETIIKINQSDVPEFRRDYANASYSDFKIVVEHLQGLHKLLFDFNGGDLEQDRRAFLPITIRIDHLWETLDDEGRKGAVACAEDLILITDRPKRLYELADFSKLTLDKRTEVKSIVKRHIVHPSREAHSYVDFSRLEPEPQRDLLEALCHARQSSR